MATMKTMATAKCYENKCATNYSIITNNKWNDAYNMQLTKHDTNDDVDTMHLTHTGSLLPLPERLLMGMVEVVLHPTVWSAGGVPKRRRVQAVREFAWVPGSPGLWDASTVACFQGRFGSWRCFLH